MPARNVGSPFSKSLRQTITQTEQLHAEVQAIKEQYAKLFLTAVSTDTSQLIERSQLLDALTNQYNIEELDKLCFLLGINHEEIGANKSGIGYALDLIEYTKRHNLTTKLIQQVKKERPFLFDI